MLKIKKYFNFIVIIAIIAYSLLSLCNRYSYAANQFISENVEELNETEYPGIKGKINERNVHLYCHLIELTYQDFPTLMLISCQFLYHLFAQKNYQLLKTK